MNPTKEQQKVISHEQGRAVVFAVAGSGKTTTVVKRINRLVGECGHMPQRILATTFSKYAKKLAKEFNFTLIEFKYPDYDQLNQEIENKKKEFNVSSIKIHEFLLYQKLFY